MASRTRATGKSAGNGQVPPSAAKPNLGEAIQTGEYRTSLEALLAELVLAMQDSPPGAKAQTAAQIRGVLKDIAALPDGKKVTKADELRDRREARLAKANASASAAGEGR